MPMSKTALLVWLVICFSVATIGGATKPGAWYRAINKPSWNPPSWLFAPVWTVLFVAMAVSAWLVWSRRGEADLTLALGLFGVQLALNALWSWLFFGWHRPDLAFFEAIILWFTILGTVLAFWPISPTAGTLLLPWLAWVGFAAFLNRVLWRMNPGAIGRAMPVG